MIDEKEILQLKALADKNIRLASKYALYRAKYAQNKYNLDIILASKMPELIKTRKNIGYDMGIIALLEASDKDIQRYYEATNKYRALYKGIEKIIDAHQNKISLFQSIKNFIIEQGG